MATFKYINLNGLSHFKSKIDNAFVAKETGKGLSTNDFTNEEKSKLDKMQDIVINNTLPFASFEDMEVLNTYEFDISDTNYHPIYTLPNSGLSYTDTEIVVAYRMTITGSSIHQVADIVDLWHNPISYPLTTILNKTLSTSAGTTGIRYLRAVYPVSEYLNNVTYPLGQEIAAYNATARHIKIEVFKQPNAITWKTNSEASIYVSSTYNGSNSATLYATRGWIFRSPQSFAATSASSATYASSYECATIGNSAIKTGATAISANHLAYLADDNLVYDISNKTKNISVGVSKIGLISSAIAANTAISATYFRSFSQLSSTVVGTISHDTLALGKQVYLRCTMDTNGNIHSDNYLSTSMSAGYTWVPIGVATASNAINMDTRNQHFFTLDLNGKLTHLDGKSIGSDSAGKEDVSNKVTSLSSSSTDTQYPSAKCVYDLIGNIELLLAEV